MFVEQRMYTAHPGKLAAWLKLYETEGKPASAPFSGTPLGFFTAEVGQLNRVVFLRAWDDPDERERGLTAREADPAWAAFRQKSGQLGALAAQENKILKPTRFSPVQTAKDFAFKRTLAGTDMVVDHRTYDFEPGKLAGWLKAYEEIGLPVQQRLLGQLLLFMVTEIGPINQVVFLWAYESLGDRQRRRDAMAADAGWAEMGKAVAALNGALKQQTVMLLKPTGFSAVR